MASAQHTSPTRSACGAFFCPPSIRFSISIFQFPFFVERSLCFQVTILSVTSHVTVSREPFPGLPGSLPWAAWLLSLGYLAPCPWAAWLPVPGLPGSCPWAAWLLSLGCLAPVPGLPGSCPWAAWLLSLGCLAPVPGLPGSCPWAAWLLSLGYLAPVPGLPGLPRTHKSTVFQARNENK